MREPGDDQKLTPDKPADNQQQRFQLFITATVASNQEDHHPNNISTTIHAQFVNSKLVLLSTPGMVDFIVSLFGLHNNQIKIIC